MGQAKQRGTFEQRRDLAIKKAQEVQIQYAPRQRSKSRLGLLMAADLVGGIAPMEIERYKRMKR